MCIADLIPCARVDALSPAASHPASLIADQSVALEMVGVLVAPERSGLRLCVGLADWTIKMDGWLDGPGTSASIS